MLTLPECSHGPCLALQQTDHLCASSLRCIQHFPLSDLPPNKPHPCHPPCRSRKSWCQSPSSCRFRDHRKIRQEQLRLLDASRCQPRAFPVGAHLWRCPHLQELMDPSRHLHRFPPRSFCTEWVREGCCQGTREEG